MLVLWRQRMWRLAHWKWFLCCSDGKRKEMWIDWVLNHWWIWALGRDLKKQWQYKLSENSSDHPKHQRQETGPGLGSYTQRVTGHRKTSVEKIRYSYIAHTSPAASQEGERVMLSARTVVKGRNQTSVDLEASSLLASFHFSRRCYGVYQGRKDVRVLTRLWTQWPPIQTARQGIPTVSTVVQVLWGNHPMT